MSNDARQLAAPRDQKRRSAYWDATIGTLRVGLIGSTLIAAVESAAIISISANALREANWPADLIVSGFAKAQLTHFLFAGPVLLAIGFVVTAIRRTQPTRPIDILLWAIYATLVGLIIIPADLLLAGRSNPLLLNVVRLGAFVGGFAVYLTLNTLSRWGWNRQFRRITNILASLVLVLVVITTTIFVRSPFFGEGSYVVSLPSSSVQASSQANKTAQPNVLWIVLDTVRADHLSCLGYERHTTPFLERWADQSLVFDKTISNAIWTVPSHASMFTGLSRREHGADVDQEWVDDRFPTVAEQLTAAGYNTAIFSNNPWVSPRANLVRGFKADVCVQRIWRLQRFSLEYLLAKNGITPFLPWLDSDYGAAVTNHLVNRWLSDHDGRPFFLFINYMEAHLPCQVPRQYRALYLTPQQVHRSYDLRWSVWGELAHALHFDYNIEGNSSFTPSDREVISGQYDAGIRYLDDRLRELLSILDKRGLLDNTLVIITSDHGEYLGEHGMWGHTFQAYQQLLHVPLLIRPPGGTVGRHIPTVVQLSDLHTTVLNAAGAHALSDKPPHGQDLLAPAIGSEPSGIAISEYGGSRQSLMPRIRATQDAGILHRAESQIAIQDGKFKYIVSHDGQEELYDLEKDPAESVNLFATLPRQTRHFAELAARWLAETSEFHPRQSDPDTLSPAMLQTLRSLGYVGDETGPEQSVSPDDKE